MKTFAELSTMADLLEQYLGQITSFIQNSINEGNNDLLTYSLAILKQAFRNSDPQMVSITAQQEHEGLGRFLNAALGHSQSRIVSETLRVTGMFALQLQDLEGLLDDQYVDTVRVLYSSIREKLQKQDIDQEVKQSSIIAIAQVLSVAHEKFSAQEISGIISIFGDRLNNELTREATLKALTLLARNPHSNIKLEGLDSLTPKFVDLMHKAQRTVHLATLEAIRALVQRYGQQFRNSAAAFQGEIIKFISEDDIQRSTLAIQCAQQIILLNKDLEENQKVLQKSV
jgi:hypothetical protein